MRRAVRAGVRALYTAGTPTVTGWLAPLVSLDLSTRLTSCGADCSSDQCNGVDLGEYDLDLHVVALLCVTPRPIPRHTAACADPSLEQHGPCLLSHRRSPPSLVLQSAARNRLLSHILRRQALVRRMPFHPAPLCLRRSDTRETHSGTGVIISTAFVHLLYHAFIMFGNTCLGELAFEPAAAAIAMGASSPSFAFFTAVHTTL